jgi:ketosteroid isomerase-like protein
MTMPSRETVEKFIATVEAGLHDEAIAQFYADDATMQENLGEPRGGRDALVAHERKIMARATEIRSRCVRPVLIDGDTVVLNWIFEFDFANGTKMRLDEIAHQTWRGDKMVRERFYYDPVQMRPV